MRLIISILSIVFSLFNYSYCTQGITTQITDYGSFQKIANIHWFIEEKQYTPNQQPIGLVFDYDNVFTTTPTILVSTRKEGSATDCLAEPIVAWSTSTSAGILVTIATGNPVITIAEADNSYYVSLYAIGE